MRTIICEKKELAVRGAEMLANVVRNKPDAVLALACGRTMQALWEQLSEQYLERELSFDRIRVLSVTEFVGVEKENSCRRALEDGLIKKTDIKPENLFTPDSEDPKSYDRLIETLGGIDLAVLGIGEDCHIGYNEPGTLYETYTHVQKLTDRTKRQLLKRGFTEKNMPQNAVTMGIKTLTDARSILLLAEGGDKAGAVYQMVYARTTPYIPAAYLQIPLEVTAIVDTEAAREL